MPAIQEALTQIAAKTMAEADMLEVVLLLAEAGALFMPCSKQNKRPLLDEWKELEAANASQARAWLKQWPDMMLGLLAGANGLFVIDLDKAKQAGEPDGLEEFKALCGQHGYDFMAATLCAKTGSGGLHVFYQMPKSQELRNTAKTCLGKSIDTRGAGGYVIIAPSRGENGKYEWLNQNPIAELPAWLLEVLTRNRKQQASEPLPHTVLNYSGYVSERERKAYQSAFDGECSKVAAAIEGTRNTILNEASFTLGRYVGAGKLDEAETYDGLYRAGQSCGLPDGEINKTINSGLKSGKLNPKVIEPHGGSWESIGSADEARKDNEPDQEKQQMPLDKYLAEVNAGQLLGSFFLEAMEFAKSSAIPTGYANLDRLLDGGLYPGLYVIGAISSLGKTTFALQMADAIARADHDVLIFSLEMSRYELIAKTLSRISSIEAEHDDLQKEEAKTARHYLSGEWSVDDLEAMGSVNRMLDIYKQWADNIYIVEGSYTLSAKVVAGRTREHVMLTGKKPVVIVDYLQILAPLADRYTDKQNVDRSIVELKRLSRDLKLPVIAVSSFNRESYATKATMNAFKESGAIEYTSDVLIGLQFNGAGESNFDVDTAKQANPRDIQLLLIKNRHGQCGQAQFKYYPKFNRFIESF